MKILNFISPACEKNFVHGCDKFSLNLCVDQQKRSKYFINFIKLPQFRIIFFPHSTERFINFHNQEKCRSAKILDFYIKKCENLNFSVLSILISQKPCFCVSATFDSSSNILIIIYDVIYMLNFFSARQFQ